MAYQSVGKVPPVYYVNLPKDLLWSGNNRTSCSMSASGAKGDVPCLDNGLEIFKSRWNRICEILGKRNIRKFTWNLKVQIQVLKNASVYIQRLVSLNLEEKRFGLALIDGSYLKLSPIHIGDVIDICILAWILWPDDERSFNPNLEKEFKKRLSSEAQAAAGRSGRWKNQMRRAAHNGCCRRVAQVRALCSTLWKLLASEELIEVLVDIEIPLVNLLADMEFCGIGVNMEGCIQARNVLGKKLRCLEKEAYKLANMAFSLYTAANIANVLFGHLKLPVPEGQNKGKRHPSTDKLCLDLLRNEHPIIPVIKEHRTLAKLLNCTLRSICSLARLSVSAQKYTLHGHWLQTSTATGRVSMEEPNLQCVEHKVDFKMTKDKNVGDDVFLKLRLHRQLSIVNRVHPKLSARYYESFTILARLGTTTYKLQLPDTSKVHPLFHVSQLKKVIGDHSVEARLPAALEVSKDPPLKPEPALAYRTGSKAGIDVPQVIIQWNGQMIDEATWVDTHVLHHQFPWFSLGDKACLSRGGIVRDQDLVVHDSRPNHSPPPKNLF